jgi:hypothetical protein
VMSPGKPWLAFTGLILAAFSSVLCAAVILTNRQVLAAEELSARAAVERTEVFVGESFVFQIQVEGHDAPQEPDVSAMKDFSVQSLGGQQNSSSSVTIVNGQVTRNVRRGYVFSYRLTPTKAGTFTIPSIKVTAGGQTVDTEPLRVRAVPPAESEDFKLRMELSSTKCYAGQPVTLNVTWYIGKDVEGFQFNFPILDDERFAVADVDTPIDPGEKNLYLRIPLGSGEVIGKKGRDVLDGTEYITVRFRKVLIPKKSGTLTIPNGTVTCNAVMGYQQRQRSRNPFFDDFFNDGFFGRRKEAVVRKIVVPSNEPVLTVLDLPKIGRPANFTGLIGTYSMEASAAPTEVSVGDPITLTVRVTGPDYLEDVDLPPLDQHPTLASDFKIPAEMAPGKVSGGVKTFTQTLRAKHPGVKAIPPIELSYFDAETGKFAIARTEPIPLNVSSTRIVTAKDAEGRVIPGQTKTELESWAEGIAYNYEGPSALRNQAHGPAMWIRSPLWIALIGFPPLVYVVLCATVVIIQRRNADPAAQQARRALGELTSSLKGLDRKGGDDPNQIASAVLEAFRQYLGSKLRLPHGALTFSDAVGALRKLRVADNTIQDLKRLFEECEASRYSGTAASTDDPTTFISRAMDLAKNLDRRL